MSTLRDRLATVVLTHNRPRELRRTLAHMAALPEEPELIVIDNASTNATRAMVERDFPAAKLVTLDQNIGAAARNIGVRKTHTPYVAFCDDDTWWAGGALEKAADILDAYPNVAVLSARVLVGPQEQEDPACAAMARSPLPSADLPGPALLGFLAGACVIRKQAFLAAGGYEPHFFIGGEEALLSLDLVAGGWSVAYAPQLTVHHYPSPARNATLREHLLARNALWVAWMRLPVASALRDTLRICHRSSQTRDWHKTILAALQGLPWVLCKRKVISGRAELFYRMLER
jgi:GT2 family glycosyltransferase